MNRALAGLTVSLVLAASALGQSLEVKAGSPLTFETLHVKADVEEGVALVDVDQTFRNTTNGVQEGIYRFRLPADAVVHSFSLWIAGKEKQGRVFERRYARAVYDSIVRRKKDPALLEQTGWRTFQVSVFPIPARADVRLRLRYAHVLPDDLGLHTLEVPVLEGGSRVNVCTFEATVRGRRGLSMLECVDRPQAKVVLSEEKAEVRWAAESWTPDGPFVVRFLPRHDGFDLAVLTHREKGEDEGWFLVRVLPQLPKAEPLPRDVVFVFDRSGSMQGEKVEQARAALLHGLGTLRAGDRFNVITFASTTASLRQKALLHVTEETLEEARKLARGLEAGGGTNIDHALRKAVALRKADSERLFLVVFMTDGEPTVGEKDPGRLIANYRKASQGAVRLFALGVGAGAKDFLLTHLAEGSRGQAEYVREGQNLEIPLSSLFAKVGSPLLAAPTIRIRGVEVLDLVPNPLPDLYRDEALVLAGRFRGGGKATLTLRGSIGSGPIETNIPVKFSEAATERPHVAQLWAKRKIDRLIDDLRLHPDVDEIRQSIVHLGVRYQVVTPYTSFLVVEPGFVMPEPRSAARNSPGRRTWPTANLPGAGLRWRGPVSEVPPNMRRPEDPSPGSHVPPPGENPATPTPADAPGPGGMRAPPSEGGTPVPPPGEDPGWADDGTPAPVVPEAEDESGLLAPGALHGRNRRAPVTPPPPGGAVGGGASLGGPGWRKGGPPPVTFDTWLFWWGYNQDAELGFRSGLPEAVADEIAVATILPALEKVLEDPRHPFAMRSQAALALGKLAASRPAVSERVATRLIAHMNSQSRHDSERECAALALGLLGRRDDRVVEALHAKLLDGRDRNPRTRSFAAMALGLLRLREDDKLHEQVLSAFLKLAASGDRNLRLSALVGMGLSGDPALIPWLVETIRKTRGSRQTDLAPAYCVEALGRILAANPSLVTEAMLKLLSDLRRKRDVHILRSVAIAMGRIGSQESLAPKLRASLVKRLDYIVKQGDTQAANFALISLGRVGGATDDSRLHNRIFDTLRIAMKKGTYTGKPFAALALGVMGRSPRLAGSRATFREVVRFEFENFKGDPRARGGHAIALGLLEDLKSVRSLARAVGDRRADPEFRGACATALGMIRDTDSVAALRAGVDDSLDHPVRLLAVSALGLVGSGTDVDRLFSMLRNARSSLYVQSAAATALARIGEGTSVEKIVALVHDETAQDLNRAMAVAALGLMADARTVPRLRELTSDANYRALFNAIEEVLAQL